MGVAVLSGVLSKAFENQASQVNNDGSIEITSADDASPSLGNSQVIDRDLDSLPSAYIATVARQESVKKLTKIFKAISEDSNVRIQAGQNVEAVQKADVVLLW